MKILVVVGYCLQVNSSANLCHISYVNGLISAGHTVDLVTVSNKNQNIDKGIKFPNIRKVTTFDASLYDQMGAKNKIENKNINKTGVQTAEPQYSRKQGLVRRLKNFIRACYGTYQTDIAWYWRVVWGYKSKEKYDYVISLSYPPVSHKVVETLLKRKKILADKWIQIWEDPWYADIFGYSHTEKVKREEKRLLDSAEKIYYVSPLTLMYQKNYFSGNSSKMSWQPLPTYYVNETCGTSDFKELCFGYFGDYSGYVRNLKPFYEAAKKEKLNVYICGNSNEKFESTESVQVHPRMPLNELKKYEDQTNVLIFVCNLKGGQIPGKIYQYSATNKYILFILDGTKEEKKVLKEYFSRYERYIFCENTEESIIDAVNKIEKNIFPSSYYSPLYEFEPKRIIEKILRGE